MDQKLTPSQNPIPMPTDTQNNINPQILRTLSTSLSGQFIHNMRQFADLSHSNIINPEYLLFSRLHLRLLHQTFL